MLRSVKESKILVRGMTRQVLGYVKSGNRRPKSLDMGRGSGMIVIVRGTDGTEASR